MMIEQLFLVTHLGRSSWKGLLILWRRFLTDLAYQTKTILKKNDRWVITDISSKPHQIHDLEQKTDWSVLVLNSSSMCPPFASPDVEDLISTAIKNGARYIYLSYRVNNKTTSRLNRFYYDKYMTGLRYNGTANFSLLSYYGGLPNPSAKDLAPSYSYELGVWKTASLQKVLRTTDISVGKDFIDYRAPEILLPFNTMEPMLKDNILFQYEAFWAIVPLQKNQLLWSLWVQKLLQEIGNSASFIASEDNGKQSDCKSLKELKNSPQMIAAVNSWECTRRSAFFSCVISLSDFMVEKKMIPRSDYRSIVRWLEILLKNGYSQPELVDKAVGRYSLEPAHSILFYPAVTMNSYSSRNFTGMCTKGLGTCLKPPGLQKPKVINNILLVIVFNKVGHYGSLEYFEKIYRPAFRYILYCGEDKRDFLEGYNTLKYPVSYVEMPPSFSYGQLGYQCLHKAMLMHYDVDGYFHVGDDVLLNIWNLHNLPTDQIWFQESMRVANVSQPTVPDIWKHDDWWPWNGAKGRFAQERAMNTLQNLSQRERLVGAFLDQLEENAGGEKRVFYEASDIFYIPQRFTSQFVYLVNVFTAQQVHIEITVPTIINGLSKQSEIARLKGSYLWYEERVKYRETFNHSNVFLHSVKMDPCLKDQNCITFLYEKYLPCL
ncbi:uncharacterized protein LOC126815880 isoform X2 [Patella vulgata]|uniref:uncharacterized protein LOC126815880 isoform X2 n=1 Tax=Patella vulgata TaxID=6465 RepID=UPI0024A8B4B3|nr:uncharacterized protein LOC126815880 isoform X2 [Patella vulgata]XP_055955332.1 uncharacterized protein LOC126815880 isoform X2 [Patella vulgata]XP_055955333.1 uncharacterized protein LOC126815880 isoform X2 [Patella vulgata]XP_055955334.1 uncharacterized protein LOC126815880 isoform X2 [Patella vulgata]XP_055955335.1 uncharacterized protein LOC126815880 isoform X2 [Patella vulgata]XP_055955336.1 uncharacterized protein LOC126815880 isoform X2 [Patella vulgata]XP_055955337.1 uncharacterize